MSTSGDNIETSPTEAGVATGVKRSRRSIIEAGVAALVLTTELATGTVVVVEHTQIDALNAELSKQKAKYEALIESGAIARANTAYNFWNTYELFSGQEPGKGTLLTQSRAQTVNTIAYQIVADPKLSSDPLAGFQYASQALLEWGLNNDPDHYGPNGKVHPVDLATALGLSYVTPSSDLLQAGARIEQYYALQATHAFFRAVEVDPEFVNSVNQGEGYFASPQNVGEDVRQAAVNLLKHTSGDPKAIATIEQAPAAATWQENIGQPLFTEVANVCTLAISTIPL